MSTTRQRIDAIARGLSDREVLTLTLHHEAALEGDLGMAAVASVIRNRAAWGPFGRTMRAVCLWPWAFSCWVPEGGAANHQRLVEHAHTLRLGQHPPLLARAAQVAAAYLADGAEPDDPTNGADHYYAPKAMKPAGAVPAWAVNLTPVAEIGRHVFFRLRPGGRAA